MSDIPTIANLEIIFSRIVTSVIAIAGFALFIMLLIGGFKYLTSGGDPKAAEGAKKTLTYAIGGIVLLAGSFMILKLIETITGAPVTQFNLTR